MKKLIYAMLLALITSTVLSAQMGPRGFTGARGPSGTIALGTITSGDPNSSPVFTNVGNATNAVFNITLPRGSVMYSGSGAPTSGVGGNQDFYLDNVAGCMYGPKVSGAWPGTCTSLVGPSGNGFGSVDVSTMSGTDIGTKIANCVANLSATYGGTCDARAMKYSSLSTSTTITINVPNTVLWLPCSTVTSTAQLIVPVGVRNVSIHGCSYQGGSNASGTAGGSVWVYTGSATDAWQIGDTTQNANTTGFHADNLNINTLSAGSTVHALGFYRTQEISLDNVYINGNNVAGSATQQTGLYLNGSGNYSGGAFNNVYINGFGQAMVLDGGAQGIGDYANASTFHKVHIVCPSGGTSTYPSYAVYIKAGDGNAFEGGDWESCYTMLRLGALAVNNTFSGVRNENSTVQIQADSGSAYNQWKAGGTLFIGSLVDNGTRNSFEDAYHRTENGMLGDYYASQQDATVTNHYRIGIGNANERGLLDRYQTDYGYRWTTGFSDAAAGEQFYQIYDEINSVYRLDIGQYTSHTSGAITAVVIQHGGVYSSATPPVVSFTGGSGSGASVTAVMQATSGGNYTVSGFAGLVGGSGFLSVPAVAFSGANQITTATANAEIALNGSYNSQTVLNAAGTGAVVLNGSNNAGSGGVIIGSGGSTSTTVATIDGSGNEYLYGGLTVLGSTVHVASVKVQNNLDAEIDYVLQAGTSASQKEALVFKDYNGNSQWYELKDQNNNWMVNGAIDGVNHFKAYSGGDDYVQSAGTGTVRVNYESNSGTGGFGVYGGNSSSLWFSVGASGYTKVTALAGSGHRCVYADSSGGLNVEAADCSTGGSGGGSVSSVGLTESDSANLFTFGTAVTTAGNVSVGFTGILPVALGGTGSGTAPGSGQIDIGNAGGTGFATVALSGDCTLAYTGNITCTKTNGSSFGTGAFATIANYVPTATTVNGHALSGNINVLPADVGNATAQWNASLVNGVAVPTSVNSAATNSSGNIIAGTSHNESVPANCAAASASGTTYTCSTAPTFTPVAGDHIQLKADVANTGSATLAVNGAAAATIKKWGGSGNLIANDLLAAHWISATYDGTNWQLEGQLGNANATQINGTTITALSGTGSTLALTTSPVFVTPSLGAASATSLTDTALSVAGFVTNTSGGLLGTATSSGSGSVALVNAPTFVGNNTTWMNSATSQLNMIIAPGVSGTPEPGCLEYSNYNNSTVEFTACEDTSYDYIIKDNGATTPLNIFISYVNGQTLLNSQAATSVAINSTTNSGTGGFIVYSGGASPAAVMTVTSSGNTLFGGYSEAKYTQGSVTASFASGAGAGTSPGTPVCATGAACDSIGGTVAMTTGTATPTVGVALTVTTGVTRTHALPTCKIEARLAASPYTLVDVAPTYTTTTIVFNLTGAALTASTAYNFTYTGCDGI